MNRPLRQAVALIAVAISSFVLVPAASSGPSPSITAVKVSGSPSHPVFTVTGHRLTVPKPNPKKSPSGQPLCPVQISGNAGLDYGNAFFVNMWDGQPQDANAQLYAAGRYRPTLNELDCIGIVVLKHTADRIHPQRRCHRSRNRPSSVRHRRAFLTGSCGRHSRALAQPSAKPQDVERESASPVESAGVWTPPGQGIRCRPRLRARRRRRRRLARGRA